MKKLEKNKKNVSINKIEKSRKGLRKMKDRKRGGKIEIIVKSPSK
jgi:hypothetical protein